MGNGKNVSLRPLEHQGNKYQQKIQKNLSTHYKSFIESQKGAALLLTLVRNHFRSANQHPHLPDSSLATAPDKAREFLKPSAISGQRHGVGCAHFLPHQLDALV